MEESQVRGPVPGTAADDADMRRMHKAQELNRVYSSVTLVGYAVILGITWPLALVTGTLTLTNGGPAGAIWVFVGVCVGMFTSVLSLAEMASLEPTTGGQYHWVSVFAPPKHRKLLSYFTGWMCALGWQSFVPGAANVGASAIQSFAIVASSSYVPQAWHVAVLTVAICTSAIIFNVFLAKKLPGIEGVVFCFFALAFVAYFLILIIMGPRSSAKEIFTDFQDNAGWGSIGTACFVGISGPVITVLGSDSAVHLAEELKDASKQLPRAMLITAGINYLFGFLMLVAFVAVVGDVQEVLQTPTLNPYVQVILNATLSRAATCVMVAFIVFFFVFASVNTNVTSSRQLYAFSRDGGLPCSRWISYVSPTRFIPIHAVLLTWFIGCLLALIPLGSTAAFVNIQTIGNSGLLVSYIICIGSRIHHRYRVGPYGALGKRPSFFLGKTGGYVINILAILFLTVFLVSGMFPSVPNPTTEAMNWSSLALAATLIVAGFSYIWLRKTYLGPNVATSAELHDVDRAAERFGHTGEKFETAGESKGASVTETLR